MSDIQIHNYDSRAEPQGQTWDTTQLQADFEVIMFEAPYVFVRRKSDDQLGHLEFKHSPRIYFNLKEAMTS